LEAADNGIVITDRSGKIVWINPAFERLTGYSAGEIVGKTPSVLKSDKHDAEFYKDLWRTILQGKVWHGELINRRKDGSLYHEEMTITPVYGEKDIIQNFIAIKQNISERKRADQDLTYERDLLQSFMDNLPDYIYFKDSQLRFKRINLAHARHLGLQSPKEAIGKTDMDFYPVSTARQTFTDERILIATGKSILGLVEQVEMAGGKLWVSSTKVPIRDKDGNISGLVGISRNITNLKHTEELLKSQKETFQTLADNVPDAVARIDRDLRFVYGNRALTKDLGLEPSAYLGKTGTELGLPVNQKWEKAVSQVFQSGKGSNFEFQFSGRDGVNYREVRLVPEISAHGEVEFVLALTRDVSEQRRIENEQRMMEIQWRQAQKLEGIGRLAAGIAHEINTPMQYVGDNTRFLEDSYKAIGEVLQSYEELLKAAKDHAITPELVARAEKLVSTSDLGYLESQIPAAIQETLEGVDRVSKIVRAMKEFSHPGGKEKVAADLNKAIESTLTVARNEWKYVAETRLELDPDLPLVPCFVGEFNQCILNLVVNAAHAIGDVVKKNSETKGVITVRTRREGDWVEVRVSDTGTGIPESARHRIFEPFFTTKGVGQGTGQGLSMVYNSIVKRHGGTANFETETGKGTTFILRLPVTPPPAIPETKSSLPDKAVLEAKK
jgi:PAS domain S-box-containing protein